MSTYIYMDHAATVPVRQEALSAMIPYFSRQFGNQSSVYAAGQYARSAVQRAREQIASLLGADPLEITFTSGGTEADNWALVNAFETALAQGKKPQDIELITSAVEHHAILRTAEHLQKLGARVKYLPVNSAGWLDPDTVRSAISPDTVLVSVMMANNETGTVMPIAQIGRICHEKGVLFHSDGVQALGKLPVQLGTGNADYMSFSAHKFGGPKGTGFLYHRQGAPLSPYLYGGRQEQGLRAGTENTAGIVGMARALSLSLGEREEESARLRKLETRIVKGLRQHLKGVAVNGISLAQREGSVLPLCLPGYLNLRFDGVSSEALLAYLDLHGIAASAGAACESGALEPSHVLVSMGLTREQALSSIRISLGRENTEEQADTLIQTLTEGVLRIRHLS